MSPSIRVQPETLESLAGRMKRLRSSDWEAIVKDLGAIHRALDRVWSSAAAAEFSGAHGRWLERFRRRGADLARVEQFWRSVAAGYRETDARLCGDVDATPRMAPKVLARPMPQGSGGNPADQPPNVRFKLPDDIAAQAISEAEAQRLFALLAADPAIAFEYPPDGCYARAEAMNAIILAETGTEPLKVWAFKEDLDDNGNGVMQDGRNSPVDEDDDTVPPLGLNTNTPYGAVAWGWHVAPMVPVVGADGSIRYRVIDPAVGGAPLSTDEWYAAIHATGAVEADWTRPGDAPENYSGSGYWTGPDPVIVDHAERTNAFFSFCAAHQLDCAGVDPSTGQGYLPPVVQGGPLIPVPEHLWWP